MGKTLVIVESPTKAKTIEKYLPSGYEVMSSMGHIRDLPSSADEIPASVKGEKWATIGVDYEHGFEPLYVVPKGKKKVVTELKRALKDADELVLATDEDREGESISWHLLDVLQPKVPVKRMVFHEITEEAIQDAIKNCREVDDNLVRAQETRRVLDRLVGYTLSPLLWKKIGGKLSAGRVQSVSVKLIVDRERERRAFRQGTYWDLKATVTGDSKPFDATMVRLAGQRLATGKDFDEQTGKVAEGADVLLLDEARARELESSLANQSWQVVSVDEKPQTRKPAPPFITSTLQQEANRKLNLSARETMRVAQDLYQRGFITYMRTDSVHLSGQAIDAARAWVQEMYGDEYLSDGPRQYTTSSKGAQEAHEAIRPSGSRFKAPGETGLSGVELKLYELIWKRTVACQMAESKQTNITIILQAGDAEFRAAGKRIDFPGFFRAYVEGSDDPDAAIEDQEVVLPDLSAGDAVECTQLEAVGHETKPPARYTEAALVKALESEGVGRPSTYATIIGTIIERGYVVVERKALVPTYRAFAVTQLLETHFPKFVDLGFTAEMEQTLDEIAEGNVESVPYLDEFYNSDNGLRNSVDTREADIQPEQARRIQLDGIDVDVRIGRFGPYAEMLHDGEPVRASIPNDILPGDVSQQQLQEILEASARGPESMGKDPETDLDVYLLNGRYGWFVQLGEQDPEDKKKKPKRSSLPKGTEPSDVDLKMALGLLALPRTLGEHPQGGVVQTALGRFGPYVVHVDPDSNKDYRSLKADDHVLTIGFDRAMELLAEPKGRGRGTAKSLKDLGEHPDDGTPIKVLDGRYGPYVKHGKINASIPKDESVENLTLERALELIEARAAKKKTTKKKTTKKKTTKKKTTKKKSSTSKSSSKS